MTEPLQPLFAAYDGTDAPGCLVGVAHHGKPVYRAAFGMANIEQGVANTLATRMPIASITKHFTCAAVLRLAQQGKLSLDEPIGRWLPELPRAQQLPTLRHLMTHSAGVRCYLDHAVFNGYATLPTGMPRTVQLRQTELNFPPGTASRYSNGGYLLLSWALERAADAPLEAVLRDGVLRDADLRSTGLPRWTLPVQAGLTTTYQSGERGWRPSPPLMEEFLGDGGMTSTVDDLLRWAEYLRVSDGPVSLRTLTTPTQYGYGLITEPWRGLRLIQHAGSLPGASAQFLMVPEEELDVVILCNRPAPAIDLSLQVLAALLAHSLQPELPAPAASEYPALVGQYFSADTGVMLGFTGRPDRTLGLSLFGSAPMALQPKPGSRHVLPFSADVGTGAMLFRRRQPTDLEFFDGMSWHGARRIHAAAPSTADLLDCAPDTYRSESAAATVRFENSEGRLSVRFCGEYGCGNYPAAGVAPDMVRFWVPGFCAGMLIQLEREHGRVQRAIVSSSRTRRTAFQRED